MLQKKIENSEPNDRIGDPFADAVESLRRGDVIVYPTETVYGLGADALNATAVERVAALKGRDPENPISIIVADGEMLESLVAEVPPVARDLMNRFWPGPLTLVLPAKQGLLTPLLNRNGGIGIRVSSHPIAIHLAARLGHPITATSANPSGKRPAQTKEEALLYFSGSVRIFVDGGRLEGTKGSTVLEIVRNQWRVIREGEIPATELASTLR